MQLKTKKEDLSKLITTQLKNNFGLDKSESVLLDGCIDETLAATKRCFDAIGNKYYRAKDGSTTFSPFHSGQYSIFLYYLSRSAWKKGGDSDLPAKIYYLNKALNSCDLYYEVSLPDIFFLDHPVGSVLGRARYSDYFYATQSCTVGGNNGVYPEFGEYVTLFAHSMVIGRSKIGSNVFISAGAYVKDANIPDNTIVFGRSPELILKKRPPDYFYSKSPFVIHIKARVK